eukprot:GILJ01005486.1.p1 GENE.GILJ01005486.1~~GILJ01005486.1.p1  ORF type:complete len:341 (+),score=21.75 GILJ01005486.1:3-1025(+)
MEPQHHAVGQPVSPPPAGQPYYQPNMQGYPQQPAMVQSSYPQVGQQAYPAQYPPQSYPQQSYPPHPYPQPYGMPPPGQFQGQIMVQAPGPMIQQVMPGTVIATMQPGLASEALMANKSLFVKQKVNILEVAVGIEQENTYKVYDLHQNELFVCKEDSECCARQCCHPAMRPFNMSIMYKPTRQQVYHLEREFRCTICCFNRPEIVVSDLSGGARRHIGRIVDRFSLLDYYFDVYDINNNLVYSAKADCCQCGLCCRCPCRCASEVPFPVHQGKSGPQVGMIRKEFSGCVKEALTDSDNFSLEFPSDANPDHRALLLSTLLFIDYRHFEESARRNNNRHHH